MELRLKEVMNMEIVVGVKAAVAGERVRWRQKIHSGDP